MHSLVKKIPSLISKTLKPNPQHRHLNPHSQISKPAIHTDQQSLTKITDDNTIVNDICDSLRLSSSWDVLSKKFRNLDINEALVEKVLLAMKQPKDAKRALGFFHWSGKTKSLELGVRSYSIAVHILVGARMNMDAKALIESILKRGCSETKSVVDSLLDTYWVAGSNPFVFDLLVQSYSKLRMFEPGLEACRYLDERGFCLSLSGFNALLRVVESSGESLALAWEIYEHMIRVRVNPDQTTVKILIGCLCKEGNLKKRVDLLERICGKRCSSPYVIVNASLVFQVLEQGRVNDAMALLKRMLIKNMVFDTIAYSLIVYAKISLGEFDNARKVFDEMLARGFRPNSFVQTLFVGAYCDEGRTDEAGPLIDDMARDGVKPYDDTFSFLVKGYAREGRPEESLGICERMLEMGFVPDRSAFNEMVGALCGTGDAKKADSILTRSIERGFVPDETTYAMLIDGYRKKEGGGEEIQRLFYEMGSRSLRPGSSVLSAFIESLCLAGDLEVAERWLKAVVDRSIAVDHEALCETLISCYVEKGDKERADGLRNKLLTGK